MTIFFRNTVLEEDVFTNINYSKASAIPVKNTARKTWHIYIEGLVQGVGFRPFVYQLAEQFKLSGWVNNNTDGVHIEFNADDSIAKEFYKTIIHRAPALSAITNHSFAEINHKPYHSFEIVTTETDGESKLLVTPDFAICEACIAEMKTPGNRRYKYPFITCTQCGPRYSIIRQVPYDRVNTTMDIFEMCHECFNEYHDPSNRRHFSQTNSCPDCAITMQLFDCNKNLIESDQTKIISSVCGLWNDGKIVAIKGIGGYLLTVDATNATVIKELRLRKQRPSKPFALMFPDIDTLQNEVHLNDNEKNELKSSHAPIVLLQLKNQAFSTLSSNEIAPGLSRIGVMLPYTPLYFLLTEHFKKPIVATSGNISNAPIVFKDDDALNELSHVADYVLVNNREIVIPQDDSIIKYSRQTQQRIKLRHARGFAPWYINDKIILPDKTILATGAMLKSSFTFLHHRNIHLSQYLGDAENADTQNNFEHTIHHFLHLFKCKPEIIIADMHPDYFSSHLSERLSNEWNIPVVKVQHHEAHFSAVLAENNLLYEQAPVLGVIWDGTGLGDDGQIWGGEFFLFHEKKFNRINHIEYFDWFLGDKMAREPRLSALSLCYENQVAEKIIQPKFSTIEWNNYFQLLSLNKPDSDGLKTSSMGRIFDAVASLLGLIDKSSFEGEAAMMLEELALGYFSQNPGIPNNWLTSSEWMQQNPVSIKTFICKIIDDIEHKKDKDEIAARFHVNLILLVRKIAVTFNCDKICFSGGVFQNELLVDLSAKIFDKNQQLYFHQQLPANDENISFGQLMWYLTTN